MSHYDTEHLMYACRKGLDLYRNKSSSILVCELIVVVSIKKEWKAQAYSRYSHASDSFLRVEAAAVSRLVL